MDFNLVYALIGFLVMLGLLGGIGINKPRGMSVKMWCVGYLAVALGFDVLAVIGLVLFLAYLFVGWFVCGRSYRVSDSCYASYK